MPMLSSGYFSVPAGHVAAIATTLDMRSWPTEPDAPPPRDGLSLARNENPDNDWYRALYRAVGQPWLWTSRLRKSDDELALIIRDPLVEVYALHRNARECGLLELDFRVADACEIAFFGVTLDEAGSGAAHWLMRNGVARARSRNVARLWLHTCTLDHPRALAFYQRAGFVAVSREVEIFPDPRLGGFSPRETAPNIPIIEK